MNATNKCPNRLDNIRLSQNPIVDTMALILKAMSNFSAKASLST